MHFYKGDCIFPDGEYRSCTVTDPVRIAVGVCMQTLYFNASWTPAKKSVCVCIHTSRWTQRECAGFTAQCYRAPELQRTAGSWDRLQLTTTALVYATDCSGTTRPRYIWPPLLSFWDSLCKCQLLCFASQEQDYHVMRNQGNGLAVGSTKYILLQIQGCQDKLET